MRGRGTAARPHQAKPWAADVQGVVRSTRLPARRGQFTRLRLADGNETPSLEAVLIGEVGTKRTEFDFAIVALARDLRVASTGVGDDMLADFEDWCQAHSSGQTELELAAVVHRDNAPARRLFARNGWECGAALGGDAHYHRWGKYLTV